MSDETVHFLPWLRSGAVSAVSAPDTLSGALASRVSVAPYLTVGGERFEQTLTLAGPGEVCAIDARAFGRRYPEDGAKDAETAHFPLIELTEPDLPWRYTPASAKARTQQLRPWLVLVVVKQQKGVSLARQVDRPAVLKIASPADPKQELPDLGDSAAWAHVQSAVAPNAVAGTLASDLTARLICPRKLEAETDYIAAVVPAFEAGRCAALGLPWESETTGPAWNVTDSSLSQVELPVFLSWTFHTAEGGDFETLARRIHAVSPPDPELGRAPLRVSDPSGHVPADFATTFQGALRAPGGGGSKASPTTWKTALQDWLNAGGGRPEVPAVAPARYKPDRDDPVLAPPMWGTLATGRTSVPEISDIQWMNAVNLEADLRVSAGLGAATVRRYQEELMASAWDQAEAARAADQQLNAAHLGIAASRRVGRRLAALPAGTRVQVLRPQHAFVTDSAGTVAQVLRSSDVPGVLAGAATLRATRAGGVVARRWRCTTRLGEAVSGTLLSATAARSTLSAALSYQTRVLPAATMVSDPTLRSIPDSMWATVGGTTTTRTSTTTRTATARTTSPTATTALPWGNVQVGTDATWGRSASLQVGSWVGSRTVTATATAKGADVSAVAKQLADGLDPGPRLTTILRARVPGLGAIIDRVGGLPARLDVALSFPEPLIWKLTAMGKGYVLPGAGKIAQDSVQEITVNNTFVAAYLLGANQEMARELIWREFPTSRARTFFRQFWDFGEELTPDIGEISAWTKRGLPSQVTGLTATGAALSVFGIRASLLSRYPNTRIYLAKGKWKRTGSVWSVEPDTSVVVEATMGGSLGPDLLYLGFPIAGTELRGERSLATNTAQPGYYLVFEEPSGEPRFGIAPGARPAQLTSWDDLTWSSLTRGLSATFADSRVRLTNATGAIEGATWGANAAHMARATWRRPFRLLLHGDQILPESA